MLWRLFHVARDWDFACDCVFFFLSSSLRPWFVCQTNPPRVWSLPGSSGREMWERLWPRECVDGTSKIKKYIETLVCLQGNVIFFQGFFLLFKTCTFGDVHVREFLFWSENCSVFGIACHEWVDVLRCHWWHLGPVGSRGSWRLVDYPSIVWNSWMGCVPIRPGTANWISMVWSNLPWYWSIVFAFKMIPIPGP